MDKICCSLFGHREVFTNIDDELSSIIRGTIVDYGATVFYIGDNGQFDRLAASCIRKLKNNYDIQLILVKPKMTEQLEHYSEIYRQEFDEIIIPAESDSAHYKKMITLRNHWMIENSDIVITYVRREYGGAYNAKKYAEKLGKQLLKIE